MDGLVDVSPFEFETSATMQQQSGDDGADGADGFVRLVQAGLSLSDDHRHAEGESLTLASRHVP